MSWEHGALAFARTMIRERGDELYGIELLVYEELKRVWYAKSKSRDGRVGLQPREVVAAAFACFFPAGNGPDRSAWFYVLAASCMRRLLVERASELLHDAAEPAPGGTSVHKLITLHRALDELQARQPRCARIVELHYFAGCSVGEIAALLGLSSDVAIAEFRFAQAWLMTMVEKSRDEDAQGDEH